MRDKTGSDDRTPEEPKALTLLDIQVAESKAYAWLHVGTTVAVALAIATAIPSVTIAMIPSAIVGVRASIVAWRRLRDLRRRRALETP